MCAGRHVDVSRRAQKAVQMVLSPPVTNPSDLGRTLKTSGRIVRGATHMCGLGKLCELTTSQIQLAVYEFSGPS